MSRAFRIFQETSRPTGPTRSSPPTLTALAEPATRAPAIVRTDVEESMISILEAGALSGESVSAAYQRKERELAGVLTTLTGIEATAMLQRLAEPRAGDRLALRFAALVADRKARLLDFLHEVRRRQLASVGPSS